MGSQFWRQTRFVFDFGFRMALFLVYKWRTYFFLICLGSCREEGGEAERAGGREWWGCCYPSIDNNNSSSSSSRCLGSSWGLVLTFCDWHSLLECVLFPGKYFLFAFPKKNKEWLIFLILYHLLCVTKTHFSPLKANCIMLLNTISYSIGSWKLELVIVIGAKTLGILHLVYCSTRAYLNAWISNLMCWKPWIIAT